VKGSEGVAAGRRARASFGCADAAHIRNYVGPVTVDGVSKCGLAAAAARGVKGKAARAQQAHVPGFCGDVCFASDEQTADFKVASTSRVMQRSDVAEKIKASTIQEKQSSVFYKKW
jgi:hypothetical protein